MKDPANPLLEPGVNTATWDHDKSYVSAVKDGDTLHLFYTGVDAAGAVTACYATSDDGVTFTKPDNTIIANRMCDSVIHDAELDQWVMVSEPIAGEPAIRIYTADDPPGPYTLVKSLSPAFYAEGKEIVRGADGRWIVYYSHGHSTERRSIGAYVSESTDLAGSWRHIGDLLTSTAPTEQFYAIGVERLQDLYYGLVMMYDSIAGTTHVDLHASHDGLVWRLRAENWIPLGAPGAWDDSMICIGTSIVEDGDGWVVYYTGSPAPHGAPLPRDSRIGRAVIPYSFSGSRTGA